jgi:predicted TPR repeat methyltransferase
MRDYEEEARRAGWHSHEVLFGLVYEYLTPGQKIIDIGIGTGMSAVLFRKAGIEISGIDYSRGNLDVCRAKGIADNLICHDIRILPWPIETNEYDHAVACGLIHFFRDISPIFKETSRILKSGGTFVFTADEIQENETTTDDDSTGALAAVHEGVQVYQHSPVYLGHILESGNFRIKKRMKYLAWDSPDSGEKIYYHAYVAEKAGR